MTYLLRSRSLITEEFAAAVFLISFGVYMGKVSRLQLLVISVIEAVMYAVNESIVLKELKVTDAGGSIIVHIFACYFGMAVTFVLKRPEDTNNNLQPKRGCSISLRSLCNDW